MNNALEPEARPGSGAQNDRAPTINVDGDMVHGDKVVTQTAGGDIVGRDKITNISNYFRAASWGEVRHQRNRQAMIQNVRDIWIKGVLENSLYGAVLIQLGLEYRSEAVNQPWNLNLRRPNQSDQVVPSSSSKIGIFDEANGALLILGAPGSGKTTLLLELARDLLSRAEQDGTASVPVVFSLSSWADTRSPLADWLIAELFSRYDVPRKLGQTWVEEDMVIPLLDGLDEVQAEHRAACVAAINVFRAEHGLAPFVVCSRIGDYEALTTLLHLRDAIVLQPLTPDQISGHLARLGPKTSIVEALLVKDEGLRELAATPLMLNVILIAYEDANVQPMTSNPTVAEQRGHLFERYVQRMLERQTELRVYAPARTQPAHKSQPNQENFLTRKTLHWLTWLARSMKAHSQSVFYLEWMQLNWLPTARQQWMASIGVAVVAGLIGALLGWLVGGPIGATFVAVVVGLIGFNRHIRSVERVHWSWSRLWLHIMAWRRFVLLFGLLSALSWGLLLLPIWPAYEPSSWLALTIIAVTLLIALSAPLVVLLFVLRSALVIDEISKRNVPNEGMQRSLRLASLIAVIIGLLGGPAAVSGVALLFLWPGVIRGGLSQGLGGVWAEAEIAWAGDVPLEANSVLGSQMRALLGAILISGLIVGLICGLIYGWRAYAQHATLRILLWRHGSTPPPWKYVEFLDYAAQRVLLFKVGGGYIFIHRLLLEYFAELEN